MNLHWIRKTNGDNRERQRWDGRKEGRRWWCREKVWWQERTSSCFSLSLFRFNFPFGRSLLTLLMKLLGGLLASQEILEFVVTNNKQVRLMSPSCKRWKETLLDRPIFWLCLKSMPPSKVGDLLSNNERTNPSSIENEKQEFYWNH